MLVGRRLSVRYLQTQMKLSSWVKKTYHPQIPSCTLAPSLRLREGQKEIARTEFDCFMEDKGRETTGVLCDKKVPVKLKVKIYQTVIKPHHVTRYRILGQEKERGTYVK